MSDKCFIKCISYPNAGSLDSRQQVSRLESKLNFLYSFHFNDCDFLLQNCISNCVDRFMEAWNIVSKTYNERIQRDRVGMQ